MDKVSVVKGDNPRKMLDEAISLCGGFPSILGDKNERVLVKANFGCHKPSVTGATTDLRVVASLIEMLQSEGYSNIVVGDGGMAGYLRVNILDYLGVTALCRQYGVKVVDLNLDYEVQVNLRSGATVKVSKTALESKVIDLAKLKTHVLATVTLGIKNLLGTVVGADKREVHLHGLDESIAELPFVIKPRLTIIEGLIGMEGRGPVAGNPKKSGLIVASKDVIAADMVACKLIGFDPLTIKHIKCAIAIASKPYKWTNIHVVGTSIAQATTPFEPAAPLGIEANPYVNRLKHIIRATPLYPVATTLMSAKSVAALVNHLGIMQEKMDYELPIYPPMVEAGMCNGCGICKNVCPANAISIAERKAYINPEKCVKCFCCVEICPQGSIKSTNEIHASANQKTEIKKAVTVTN